MLVLAHRLSPVTLSAAVKRTVSGLPGLTGQNVRLLTNTLNVDQESLYAPVRWHNMLLVGESTAKGLVNSINPVK